MKKFNYRFGLYLCMGLALAGGGLFALHRVQYGRIGEALRWQAQRAEDAGRLDQAVRYLAMYLELRPADINTQAHLGELLADSKLAISTRARTRALFVLEQVLLKDAGRAATRRMAVSVALDLGRFDVAQGHLEILLRDAPEDGLLQHQLGACRAGLGKLDQAAACYRTAIQLTPSRVESYTALAELLRKRHARDRRPELAQQADEVMESLVRANPQTAAAYLARWRFQSKYAPVDKVQNSSAAADVAKALELAPADLEVLLAAADLAQMREDTATALTHLQRARELFPQEPRVVTTLAVLQFQANQQTEALAGLRRAGEVSTGRGRVDILWTLGNLLIDQGNVRELPNLVTQLRALSPNPAPADFLQARLLLQDSRWAEAAQALERVRPLVENTPELAQRIDLSLGLCYGQLDDSTRQIAALGRVVAGDPAAVGARLGLGESLAAQGRFDEALEHYRHVSALAKAPPTVWREIARLLLLRNLRSGTPDWNAVDEALAKARAAQPGAVDVILLTADAFVARGKPDQARAVLTAARDINPREVQFYTALATLVDPRKDPEEAGKLLAEAERQAGDTVALRLARLRMGKPASIDALVQGIDAFSADEQAQLLQGLATECYRTGKVAEARRLWTRLAASPQHDHDLRLRLLLFNLALAAADEPAMQELQAAFRQIEGGTGPLWRYAEARRLIRTGQGPALDEARALLDAAATQRPAWPALFLAQAQLDERKNSPEQAIANYRRAIDLGERSPRVLRQLVELLCQRQRFDEAQQEIQKLQKQAPLADDLKRLAVAVSLRSHDTARAVQLALETVAADSRDYRDYLWLGQVLAATGKNAAEAEARFRQAVALAEEAPEPWVALVQFLAGTNRKDEAQKVLDQAAARLPRDKAPLALARCYELMGQSDRALAQLQAALKDRPGDVPLLRQLADFHLRGLRTAEAEVPLRNILEASARAAAVDRDWARRQLAFVLSSRADAAGLAEALKLIGCTVDPQGRVAAPSKPGDEDMEEQRIRARVLSQHFSRETRLLAVSILEGMKKRVTLQPEDQFLLARLYESTGAWPRARDMLRSLAVAKELNPAHLTYYVQVLLRHGDISEAERQAERLNQLEKARNVEPGAFGSVELQAQVLLARRQGEKCIALLTAHAAARPERTERNLLVATYLARLQQVEQALEWCAKACTGCRPEAFAAACVEVARAGKPTAEQFARLEEWLQKAVNDNAKSLELLVYLADLKDLRGQHAEQEALYRRILQQDPRHAVALNNLAWLVAHRSADKGEALELINKAIAIAGPRSDLLDTRAFIYLEMGQPQPSLQDLQTVMTEKAGGSSFYHLARAQYLAGNRPAAIDALKKARGAGVETSQLHPLDQGTYRKVVEALEQ